MNSEEFKDSFRYSMALLAAATSLTMCCAIPLIALAVVVSMWNGNENDSEIKQLRAAVAYYHGGGK